MIVASRHFVWHSSFALILTGRPMARGYAKSIVAKIKGGALSSDEVVKCLETRMKFITVAIALGSSNCFAQSVLSPAQENWVTEKEAKELAVFRKIRPDSVVVRFDFLTSNAIRIVATPAGVTYTFVGGPAPKEWNLPVPLWRGVDNASGVYMDVTPTDAFIYGSGPTYTIHALGDGLAIISKEHVAEKIKRDRKEVE